MNSSPLAAIWHWYPLLAWVACARFCSLPLGSLSYLNFYLKLRLDSNFSYGTGLSSGTQGGSGHTPLPLELREPCRWSNAHLPQSRNPKDIRLPRGRKPTVRSAERSTGRHCAPCWNYASDILPRANPVMKYWRC